MRGKDAVVECFFVVVLNALGITIPVPIVE
jgi:hypothetical protein